MRRLLAVTVAVAVGVATATPALAHEGNPNFHSAIRSVRPAVPGLRIEVFNYDDRLLLVNRSGKDVIVRGYDGEPYVRLDGDGTVAVNVRSEAHYLNQDRFAAVSVPSAAGGGAKPEWKVMGQSGRYEWHDHRIHWMSKQLPPAVRDKDKRTKVFDWRVPIEIGAQKGRVAGDLYWEPASQGGIPRGAVLALAVLVFTSIGFVEFVRRRRRLGLDASRKESRD